MTLVIIIQELHQDEDQKWRLGITHGEDTRECEFEDPLLHSFELNDESVRWMLEDYPTCFPYDKAATQATKDALQQYGIRLEEQLNLYAIIEKFDPEGCQIWTVDISASTSTSSLHKIYWESLEECFGESGAKLLVRRLARPQPPEHTPSVPAAIDSVGQNTAATSPESLVTATSCLGLNAVNQPKRAFNVLVVVSRPDMEYDINPLVAIEAMYEALQTHLNSSNGAIKSREDLPIKIEVSRPGTYTALEEHLASRTAAWAKFGGSGGWFDLVHFDCHGVIRDGKANLLFLSNSGKRALRRPGAKIGDLLHKYHIPAAVLHACESAKVGPDEDSNMAQTLIRAGLKTVVAMAFKFTSSAAKIFTRAFYEHLLGSSTFNLQTAVRAARKALAYNKQRQGRFNVAVELSDSIIPILYVAADVISPIGQFVEPLQSPQDILDEKPPPSASNETDVRFSLSYGREKDVLQIEWSLLRSPFANVVMITGEPGIGKTTLVFGVLLPLWVPSQLVWPTVSHWDFRLPNPARIIPELQKLRHSSNVERAQTRKITILENLDAVIHPLGVNATEFGPERVKSLRQAIHDLFGTNNLVIICSRSDKNWCNLPESQIHHLGPLPKYYAEALVSREIQAIGKEDFWQNQRQSKYLEHILGRLNYNPLSLEIMIDSMVEGRAKWFRRGVGREEQDKMGIFPDTPELLFNMSIRDSIGVNQSHPISVELLNLVRTLLHVPGKYNMQILYGLSVPSSVYRSDWHNNFASKVSRMFKLDEPLTGKAVDEYVSDYLLDSGWMNSFDTIFAGGVSVKYYRIHPLFTNALRTLLISQQDCDPWLSVLTHAHMDMYGGWARENLYSSNKRERFFKIQVESFAFMNAIDSFVYTLQLNQMPQQLREVRHAELMWLIQCLSGAALDTNSPILEMDLITARIEKALTYFENRLGADDLDKTVPQLKSLGNVGHVVDLFKLLCNWYEIKNPLLAGHYADCCLKIVVIVCDLRLDWDEETRASIASILITRGKCNLGFGSSTGIALQAFEMALRCYKRENSEEWHTGQSAYIRGKAYPGLLTALELLKRVHSYDEISSIEEVQALAYSVGTSDYLDGQNRSKVFRPGFQDGEDVEEAEKFKPESLGSFRLANAMQTLQDLSQAGSLFSAGQILKAKQVLINGLGDAMVRGDNFAEYNMRMSLIEMAEEAGDWEAAASHISRTIELEDRTSGGLWFAILPPDRLMREARHGVIYLRLKDLQSALICFDRGYEARSGFYHPEVQEPVSPESFIENVLEVGRFVMLNMTSLDSRLLTFDEFLDLDDLMQDLTVEFIRSRWPERVESLPEAQIRRLMQRSEYVENMRGVTFEKASRDIHAPDSGFKPIQLDTREITHSQQNWRKDPAKSNGGDDAPTRHNPPRVKVAQKAYVDVPCDLERLEDGMPLYDADPEGALKGKLRHPLPALTMVSWVLQDAKDTLQTEEQEGERKEGNDV